MINRIGMLALLSMTGLYGCMSLCDRAEASMKTLETKLKDCGGTTGTFNKASCETSIAKCPAADQTKIGAMLDCMDALPTCTTATQDTFGTSSQACFTKIEGISADCTFE